MSVVRRLALASEKESKTSADIRELERQVDGARSRNRRAEGVVATAQHLMDS